VFADNILGELMGHTDSVDGLCQTKARCLHCLESRPECANAAFDWLAFYDVDEFICDEVDSCNQEACQCAVDFANNMVDKITNGLVNVHEYYDLFDTDLCVKSETGGPGCSA